MKAKLVRDAVYGPSAGGGRKNTPAPTGTVIEHPDAWKLVRMGMAEPEDDECRERAGMNGEQMRKAQYAQDKFEKKIRLEDRRAYDDGEMLGYDEDGEWIPGPNYMGDEDDDD
jgi:hypothetical protein